LVVVVVVVIIVLVEEVLAALRTRYTLTVEEVVTATEDVVFKLPKVLAAE
jgi:4-hydroxy-3-methylbut-2-enyl diphosphate reductase